MSDMGQTMEFKVDAGWRPLLKDLGVRPDDVLRRAGLPRDLLSRPDARLTTDEYFRFWQGLEAEADDPRLPIRIAEAYTAEGFAPPLFAALCSPDLGVAVERIARYKRLIGPMVLDVERGERSLSCGFAWLNATVTVPPRLAIAELAFLVRLARMATREHVCPVELRVVDIPGPVAPYEEWFGARLTRGSRPTVTFSREDADRPFLTANDAMWKMFEPELRRRLAELEESATVAERVRAVLLESLPSGQSSMGDVASRLATSKRTLQRRLEREGTSYQSLLSETREQLAKHYLARTALSCAEISFLLGYEEPNSFFRAFHDWTGDSPQSARQSMRDS